MTLLVSKEIPLDKIHIFFILVDFKMFESTCLVVSRFFHNWRISMRTGQKKDSQALR